MPAGVKSTDGSQAGTSTSLGRRTQPWFRRTQGIFHVVRQFSSCLTVTVTVSLKRLAGSRRLKASARFAADACLASITLSIAHDTLAAQGIGVSKTRNGLASKAHDLGTVGSSRQEIQVSHQETGGQI